MSGPSFPPVSNRDVQKQQQQSMRTHNGSAKSSTASKAARAGRPESTVSDADSEDGAEEADSSANEGSDDEDSEPDVMALSGAQRLRLAGFEAGDMFADDSVDAVAGANASDENDDDYAGVEDVSDDGEDMGNANGLGVLRAAAEQDLIEEFPIDEELRIAEDMTEDLDAMALQRDEALAQSLSLQYGDGMHENEFSLDDDPFAGLQFNDSAYQELYDEAERGLGMCIPPKDERADDTTGTKKRVRFLEPEMVSRSSSVSSEDDPDEMYPDLFDAQDDPALRQRFGLDVDLDAGFHMNNSDAGSCYDFDGEEERMAFAIDDEESDSDEDSYGGDTDDEGDKTDVESEEEILAMHKRAAEARKSAPSTPTPVSRRASPTSQAAGSPSAPKTGRGPRLGKFVVDKTKATISSDTMSNRIKIQPPQQPAEKDKAFWKHVQTMKGRNGPARSAAYYSMRTGATKNMPERPFTAQSTLGSMFNGNLDILRNNDVSGIGGHLFPATMTRSNSLTETLVGDSDSEVEEVNMQDYIDLEDDDDGSDGEDPEAIFSPVSDTQSSLSSLDARRSDSLLDHLDQHRGLVGSFRRNQNFAKQVSSLASHPVKRASTLESNALQKGRRAAANIPITPARKKRISQDLSFAGAGVRKPVSSPLSAKRPHSRPGSSSGMSQTLGPSLM
ncbi:hypothetical protein LTS10_007528 [Elasticomyces elasticus]|nr:hypothetical protein LTS10_007528 [Elasticomyces elasticus]